MASSIFIFNRKLFKKKYFHHSLVQNIFIF